MSFEEAGHLPNVSSDGPLEPRHLPRQRRGVTPQMHGRYPDHDVLAHADRWDDVTRRVVLDRMNEQPPIRVFGPQEEAALRAFCDVVLAQDAEPRIPVLEMVDRKLFEGRGDGYRYADLPDDRETWRRVAQGLDEQALARGGGTFAVAGPEIQAAIVEDFSRGDLHGGVWRDLPAGRAFQVVMRGVVGAYYSHPWAWNEIGFGGPAYPQGYMRLGIGQREPWEGEETHELATEFQEDVERGQADGRA
jgi:Gluconate 2-dehydrogenase subunit 3